MSNNAKFENIEFYVEIQYEIEDNGADICIEIPISIKVFFIALILAEAEKRCTVDDDTDKEEDVQKK